MIKIAFDIDGVVLDFTDAFLRRAKEIGLLPNVKYSDIIKFRIDECTDMSYEKVGELVNYILANPYDCKIKAMEGAINSLTKLSEHLQLVFITARPHRYKKQTKNIIYSSLPNVDKDKIKIVHSAGLKKHETLNKLGIDWFVEDRTRNCRALNNKGINTLLYDRPWNQTEEPFYRVNTWEEIHNFVFNSGKDFFAD